MMARTTFLALLLAVATVATPAQARVLPSTVDLAPVPLPDVLAIWMGRQPSPLLPDSAPFDAANVQAGEVAGAISARSLVLLHPLGDVSADGKAEILMEIVNPRTLQTTLQAVPPADPKAALWTLEAAKDRLLVGVADVDADGVLDPLIMTAEAGAQSIQRQGAGPASAVNGRITQTLTFVPLSGAAGTTRFTSALPQELSLTEGSSMLPGGLGGAQNKTTRLVSQLESAGPGAFASFADAWNTTRSKAALPLQNATSTTVEADAVVRIMDASGKVTGTISLAEPNVNPLEIATNSMLGDKATQVLALSMAKVGQAQEVPSGVPRVDAFTQTGGKLWTASLDAFAGVPMLVPSLADVDGDKATDLGVLENRVGPDLRSVDSRFVLLSGATGAVKGSLSTPGAMLAVVPFGAQADGKADMLLAVAEDTATRALTLTSLAGPSLRQAWQIPLTPGSLPLNAVKDPLTGNLQGFTDLDLDGVPDVLVGLGGPARAGLASGLELTLYSGVDGKVAWTRHVPNVAAATLLTTAKAATTIATGAATNATAGPAASMLALVTKTGPEPEVHAGVDANASLEVTTYSLEDGSPVWRLRTLTAEQSSKLSPALALLPSLEPMGDLDADGVADLALRVEHDLDGARSAAYVTRPDGSMLDASEETVAHNYLVSGKSGDVLMTQTDEVVADGATARVPVAAAADMHAEPLSASAKEAAGGAAPAFEVAFAAASIFAVAVGTMRRRGRSD